VAPRVTAPLPPPRGRTLVTGAFRGGGFRSTQEHDAVASRDTATLRIEKQEGGDARVAIPALART